MRVGALQREPSPIVLWLETDAYFFFLTASYIEIRPPSTHKGMCECVRVFPPGLLFLLGKKA